MIVPLYAFLEGDTLALLVLVHPQDPIAKVADNLMQAASMRVEPFPDPRVYATGRLLDPKSTVSQAGLAPLERIDVRRTETPWLINR